MCGYWTIEWSPLLQVSPVDGRVLNCGTVEGNHVEQVKGVHYSLDAFLGPGELTSTGHTAARTAARSTTAEEVAPKEKRKEEEEEVEKQLYHVVIYLAPGDCHHFHSPTEWRAQLCRHIPGKTREREVEMRGWKASSSCECINLVLLQVSS